MGYVRCSRRLPIHSIVQVIKLLINILDEIIESAVDLSVDIIQLFELTDNLFTPIVHAAVELVDIHIVAFITLAHGLLHVTLELVQLLLQLIDRLSVQPLIAFIGFHAPLDLV